MGVSMRFHPPARQPALRKLGTSLVKGLLCLVLWFSIGGHLASALESPPLPRPDHIVLVILENHSYDQIINSPAAPYVNQLAQRGAVMTRSFGTTHPSQPNYLMLFSGSTQGVSDNSCPHMFTTPNLASALRAARLTFRGYSEDLPEVGAIVCTHAGYTRKHNPWVNWQGAPSHLVLPSENASLRDLPSDWSRLPTVSVIVPNNTNNMHDGSDPMRIRVADAWLAQHLNPYVDWSMMHNSLLILTWDEDDGKSGNQIPTILVGPMVVPGRYDDGVSHATVLRTIEDLLGLSHSGEADRERPIVGIWRRPGGTMPHSAGQNETSRSTGPLQQGSRDSRTRLGR